MEVEGRVKVLEKRAEVAEVSNAKVRAELRASKAMVPVYFALKMLPRPPSVPFTGLGTQSGRPMKKPRRLDYEGTRDMGPTNSSYRLKLEGDERRGWQNSQTMLRSLVPVHLLFF